MITDLSIENLQNNDILHISNYKNYEYKHLDGNAIGWNLICKKATKDCEPLFIL